MPFKVLYETKNRNNLRLLDCKIDGNNNIIYEKLSFRNDVINTEIIFECVHCYDYGGYNLEYSKFWNNQYIECFWYTKKRQVREYQLLDHNNTTLYNRKQYDYHDNGVLKHYLSTNYEAYYDDNGDYIRDRKRTENKWEDWVYYDDKGNPVPLTIIREACFIIDDNIEEDKVK
jgi:hypothetical protein